MLRALLSRFRQRHRTLAYPRVAPTLPDRFRGRPLIDPTRCPPTCSACVSTCPTQALLKTDGELRLDLGRCLFCPECATACGHRVLEFTRGFELATRDRAALVLRGNEALPLAPLSGAIGRLLGRSLKLRQVSAGGCSGCGGQPGM